MPHSPIQSLPPELLEMVLLQLPMCDLLFAQSVCKHWEATIKGSSKVRKALFFDPESSPLGEIYSKDSVKNQLLYNRFRGWQIPINNEYNGPVASFIEFSSATIGDLDHIWQPTSSWRKMFLTQPPYEDLSLFIVSGVEGWESDIGDSDNIGSSRETFRFHRDEGITMGALMDELERIYNSKPLGHTMWVLKFELFYSNED